MKLWGGRFSKNTNKLVEQFTESISFDKILYKQDITGSIAHVKMLAKQKIISQSEKNKIIDGLNEILVMIDDGNFEFRQELEDIHMNIEKKLSEIIGEETAGKLHTARSRNDQVILDVKLFVRDEYLRLKELLKGMMSILVHTAKKEKKTVMPGFTHMQHAQPVYLSHHMLAYYQKFKRDYEKTVLFSGILNECPLGAGALAGTTHKIDRHYTAKILEFSKPTDNSMDTVSDRDFIMDYLYISSLIMLHLSQMSEEFVIWSSQEYNFIEIDDAFTTGSSIMPNKKNPDVCELTRGKTARIISNLNAVMIMLKGLPLTYNRDLQDDKKILFDSVETVNTAIAIYIEMLSSIKFKKDNLKNSVYKGFTEATDIADFLVTKNVPFRQAHHISGSIVKYCIENNKTIQQLTLKEYKKFSEKFSDDIFKKTDIEYMINNRKSYGGTGLISVNEQIKNAEKYLGEIIIDN